MAVSAHLHAHGQESEHLRDRLQGLEAEMLLASVPVHGPGLAKASLNLTDFDVMMPRGQASSDPGAC